MYAVFQVGGQQFRASVGETVRVEALSQQVGDQVVFDNVLLVSDGSNVQVGFSVTVYVAAPLESKAGRAREEAVAKLWEELKRLADDVAPPEQRTARVQVEQSARVVLRPENEFKPEVNLIFHVFPRGLSMEAVTQGDRDRMAQLEKRLHAFGVKQGRA